MKHVALRRLSTILTLAVVIAVGCGDSDQGVTPAGGALPPAAVEESTASPATAAILEPRAAGPLTAVEAAERAVLSADDPRSVDPVRDVEVRFVTWAEAALLLGGGADTDPRFGPDTEVVVAIVHARVTNTDLPAGAEPTTYDSFVAVYEKYSAMGFTICMGCDGNPALAQTTTTTAQ